MGIIFHYDLPVGSRHFIIIRGRATSIIMDFISSACQLFERRSRLLVESGKRTRETLKKTDWGGEGNALGARLPMFDVATSGSRIRSRAAVRFQGTIRRVLANGSRFSSEFQARKLSWWPIFPQTCELAFDLRGLAREWRSKRSDEKFLCPYDRVCINALQLVLDCQTSRIGTGSNSVFPTEGEQIGFPGMAT
jgi:hypothetical protein